MNASAGKGIALFVRNPVAGQVKTRLGRDLGHDQACSLYRAMVQDVLSSVGAANVPVYLFHDGTDASGLPAEWTRACCAVFAQQGNSIGDRMAAAFDLLFADNLEQVAIIGSDIPGIDPPLLAAAFQALDSVDGAIAPAVDGGYCLIALTRKGNCNRLFQEVQWSTDSVLQATLARFEECGLRVNLLASRQDIDTMADLMAYCLNPAPVAHATNAWLTESGYLPVTSTSDVEDLPGTPVP